jgi:hypothetical protein
MGLRIGEHSTGSSQSEDVASRSWLLTCGHDRIAGVIGTYATVITVVALLLAGWALICAALNRRPTLLLFAAGVLLETMLLVFAVGGVVQMAGSDRHFARAEFVGYLLGALVIPPLAFYWARGERSRSGMVVIALVFLITPVMVLRVQQVWAGSVG